MAKVIDTPADEPGASQGKYELGVSRPPLEVLDLPTPEAERDLLRILLHQLRVGHVLRQPLDRPLMPRRARDGAC